MQFTWCSISLLNPNQHMAQMVREKTLHYYTMMESQVPVAARITIEVEAQAQQELPFSVKVSLHTSTKEVKAKYVSLTNLKALLLQGAVKGMMRLAILLVQKLIRYVLLKTWTSRIILSSQSLNPKAMNSNHILLRYTYKIQMILNRNMKPHL